MAIEVDHDISAGRDFKSASKKVFGRIRQGHSDQTGGLDTQFAPTF